MLLPDMFDEKVALMSQEAELSDGRTTEQGTLIALTSGQMVTLFTTGPEGRVAAAPVEVVLDGAKGAAGEKHYQSARIILHATGNSDYKRPQLNDGPPERDTAGETRTRALPSLISNAVRRRPWTLGIASTPAPLPRRVSKTLLMPSTPSGADSPLKQAKRNPLEDDVDDEGGVDCENENNRVESVVAVGWFGGMTRWASKLWTAKRAERRNTPDTRE